MQVSVVIAMAALVARIALRHRAEARHALWLGTLLWVLFTPAIFVIVHHWGPGIWTLAFPLPGLSETANVEMPIPAVGPAADIDPRGSEPEEGSGWPAIHGGVDRPGPRATTSRPAPPVSVRSARLLLTGIVLVWLMGSIVGLARIVVGWKQLFVFSGDLRPLDPERHGATLARVRELSELRRFHHRVLAPDLRAGGTWPVHAQSRAAGGSGRGDFKRVSAPGPGPRMPMCSVATSLSD